jgi:hypothetical protein
MNDEVFTCSSQGCDYKGTRNSMVKHVTRTHLPPEEAPFWCALCGYKGRTEKEMRRHENTFKGHTDNLELYGQLDINWTRKSRRPTIVLEGVYFTKWTQREVHVESEREVHVESEREVHVESEREVHVESERVVHVESEREVELELELTEEYEIFNQEETIKSLPDIPTSKEDLRRYLAWSAVVQGELEARRQRAKLALLTLEAEEGGPYLGEIREEREKRKKVEDTNRGLQRKIARLSEDPYRKLFEGQGNPRDSRRPQNI